jgi:hypothetical protein
MTHPCPVSPWFMVLFSQYLHVESLFQCELTVRKTFMPSFGLNSPEGEATPWNLTVDFDGSSARSIRLHSPFSDCDIAVWDPWEFGAPCISKANFAASWHEVLIFWHAQTWERLIRDTHFDPGFDDQQSQMNDRLQKQWNETVAEEDPPEIPQQTLQQWSLGRSHSVPKTLTPDSKMILWWSDTHRNGWYYGEDSAGKFDSENIHAWYLKSSQSLVHYIQQGYGISIQTSPSVALVSCLFDWLRKSGSVPPYRRLILQISGGRYCKGCHMSL